MDVNNNFRLLIKYSAMCKDDPRYEKDRDTIVSLYKLGLFMQEMETEIWNGYPYIYANMRVLIEELMNFFIKRKLKISIIEGCGGNKWLEDVKDGRKDFQEGSTLYVKKKSEFNLKRKIELVTICLTQSARERGVELSSWWLQNWRAELNQTNHHIFLPIEDAVNGFNNRFQLIQEFHDTIYKDLVKMYFDKTVPPYLGPSEEDLKKIVSKYNDRIKSYG